MKQNISNVVVVSLMRHHKFLFKASIDYCWIVSQEPSFQTETFASGGKVDKNSEIISDAELG